MNIARKQQDDLHAPEITFLISQPRAGSTLLQKILAAHSKVVTCSEPWVMLPATMVFRKGSVVADYSADWASVAVESFIESLPQGRETYIEGLRRMYGYLYQQALAGMNGRVFVDKTPRYYLIIPLLLEIFPECRIILLVRNPLAVLVSVINTWSGVGLCSLEESRNDLLVAPGLLNDAMHLGREQIAVLRYEDLLSSPEEAIRKLCGSLQLEFQDQMLQYGLHKDRKWALGDQNKVFEEAGVDLSNKDKWIESLNHASVWRLCNDYMEMLGEDLFSSLGYSWEDAERLLTQTRPNFFRRSLTLSLGSCVKSSGNATGKKFTILKATNFVLKLLSLTKTSN